jgi:hypothetical protein
MFTLRRDEHGFACAIEQDDRTVLHLYAGSERNEEEAERLVCLLNRGAKAEAEDAADPPAHGLPASERMIPPAALEFGQTPFDNLTRGELLRLLQAYHHAMMACRNFVLTSKEHDEQSMFGGDRVRHFWTLPGRGGVLLHYIETLMTLSGDGGLTDESRNIYFNFFRYAAGLFFGDADPCDCWGITADGNMSAPFRAENGQRPLTWSDLLPTTKPEQGDLFERGPRE